MCLTLHDVFFSDDFSSNIENSHSATAQAASQLLKASKLQKSNSSLVIFIDAYFVVFHSFIILSAVCISRPLSKIELQFKILLEGDIVVEVMIHCQKHKHVYT